jgi:hypothetical protein
MGTFISAGHRRPVQQSDAVGFATLDEIRETGLL